MPRSGGMRYPRLPLQRGYVVWQPRQPFRMPGKRRGAAGELERGRVIPSDVSWNVLEGKRRVI